MYFPSLGQIVIATPHWLGCSLQLCADTQSLRQFSPQLSPWQLPVFHPFHLKLAKAVISAPALIHFLNGVQIVDDCWCQKKSPKCTTHWHPTSRGPFLERVTRRGKCIYTIWIQPFPLLPEKLFNTRKAAHELLMAVLFAVTWIMGRQAWHMYPSCSIHWVMQAEMPLIYHVFLLQVFFFSFFSPFFSLLLTWCQQASPWTRMVWFILLMAPRSVRWTRMASSPLSLVPTTWHRLALWPVTTAWTSIRWLIHWRARQLLTLPLCSHRACHSATLCPRPLLFSHLWLITDMQCYITYIYIYVYTHIYAV